jgi:hypothetical protein
MKRIILAVLITSFAVGSAMAQSCATKAALWGCQDQLRNEMRGGRLSA